MSQADWNLLKPTGYPTFLPLFKKAEPTLSCRRLWTTLWTTTYAVSMLPALTERGVLPPGEHTASWNDVIERFGGNRRRERLLHGLREAASNLRDAGVRSLWLDGSFVTGKPEPNDWDGVWDTMNADLTKVDPVLTDRYDMATGRYRQKAKYGGELLIGIEGSSGKPFHEFFQQDTNGDAKGIVLLDLRTLP